MGLDVGAVHWNKLFLNMNQIFYWGSCGARNLYSHVTWKPSRWLVGIHSKNMQRSCNMLIIANQHSVLF